MLPHAGFKKLRRAGVATMPPRPRVVPQNHARRLFATSLLTIFSIWFSAVAGLYDLTAVASAILATSLNYWRLPTYGWRRTIDMYTVSLGLVYQLVTLVRSAPAEVQLTYCSFLGLAILCYLKARHCHLVRRDTNLSTMWHAGLHLSANVGNVYLYRCWNRELRSFGA